MFHSRHDAKIAGVGARQSIAACVLVAAVFLSPAVPGQSQAVPKAATLEGYVRDVSKHPVAGVSVHLRPGVGAEPLTVHTNSEGAYHFFGLAPGTYNVEAETSGSQVAIFGPFQLEEKQTKEVDLTLQPPRASEPQSTSPATPEFFDEPKFTVAGVTDTTNLGGHGSNATLGITESLTKGVVSLSRESAASSPPASNLAETEQVLRLKAEQEPESFKVNHQLGKLLLDNGKSGEAVAYLEQASRLNPGNYDNSYELALAYAGTGEYEQARLKAQSLLAGNDKAELHHLLGEVNEKLGSPLEAVREYQRASELQASETNLFDWAAELLIHRATEPTIEVFTKGSRLFPQSARMLAGLGVAQFAQGNYNEAVQSLCEASDLNPKDPAPYLLLGKMLSPDSARSADVVSRLKRFAQLQPKDALANYYYALALWEGRRNSSEDAVQIKDLLARAIQLDPKLGAAYLHLGILYSEQHEASKAISAYEQAIKVDPGIPEAHYRLGQAYLQRGATQKGKKEIELYRQLAKETTDQLERERREIRQFVYTLQGQVPRSPSR